MAIRLSFGTAGIRAKVGPGDDQLNLHALRGIAHALCAELTARSPGARQRGLCVAFDGRTDSAAFAAEVVRVARRHGFAVSAFEAPVPTPLLAFCARRRASAAGVMITASHNPPDENGVKVYLDGGAQIGPPDDAAIAARLAVFEDHDLPVDDGAGPYVALGEAEVDAYLSAVEALVPRAIGPLPAFAYSALAGVGGAITRRMFARLGADHVHEVASQAHPRSDFAGLTAPNPEHPSARAALAALADEAGVDLAFAHDPDADRLAVMVREGGVLRALTGDEVGALLCDFLLSLCPVPEHVAVVSTVVSGSLAERVAASYGATFARTPTGFKWIAARGRALERDEGRTFLLGYEEAIGYAFGALTDDKDGIAALLVLLSRVRELARSRLTLTDALDALARRHGAFANRQLTFVRDPAGGAPDLLARLRAADPADLLGAGATRIDPGAPPALLDLLVFVHPSGTRLCVRPSGTEPKLKLYLEARSEVDGDLKAARARAAAALDRLEARLSAL